MDECRDRINQLVHEAMNIAGLDPSLTLKSLVIFYTIYHAHFVPIWLYKETMFNHSDKINSELNIFNYRTLSYKGKINCLNCLSINRIKNQ